jgi:hypothetical protein
LTTAHGGGKVKKLIAGLTIAVAVSLAVSALAFGAHASTISVSAKLSAKQEIPPRSSRTRRRKGSSRARSSAAS